MVKRLNWREPRKELDGMTCNEWLAEEYAKEPRNQDVADRLAGLLGRPVTKLMVTQKASMMKLGKTPEARSRINELRGEVQRLPLAPAVVKFDNIPEVEYKRCVVTSDWHFPFYDERLANRMFVLCQKWKPPIKHHIIGGDFFDLFRLSKFYDAEGDEDHRKTEDDLRDGEMFLSAMAKWFDEIFCIQGNHEKRLRTGKLAKEIGQERLQRMWNVVPDKITFSKWPKVILNGKWRITHPKPFWQNPAGLANRLASIHLQNIVMAHGHGMALSRHRSGKFIVVDSGGMMDPVKLDYYMLEDTAHFKWLPGFLIIDDDKVHTFNYLWTDWSFYRERLDIAPGW